MQWATIPANVHHDVPGQVAKAGQITDLHPAPSYVEELKRKFS
jgi:hydroxymethylglutaryl-CoA lyase